MRDSRKIARGLLVTVLFGPMALTSVCVLAADAERAGFVVLPDGAPRFSGPQGREADITELVATRD